MADLFDKDSDTIGLHLKNIYKSGELDRLATTEKSSVVRIEGTRKVRRQIQFYNLDAIAALGGIKKAVDLPRRGNKFFAKSSRADRLAGIFGNLDQTVFGEPAYQTVESKAAHLFYFVVKNHPFIDGNKRSGAFLFVDFLHRKGRLLHQGGDPIINDTGLAALTLLVAESAPNQKDTIIKLIMNLLCDPEAKHI